MAGSVVVEKGGVFVLRLLEEGVSVANKAANRQVAVLSHSEPVRLEEDMKIMVSFVVNGTMIIWRIRERMDELFRKGVNLVGYDVYVDKLLDGGVYCRAFYVLVTDMNGVYLEFGSSKDGNLEGYVEVVTTVDNITSKKVKLEEGGLRGWGVIGVEIARKYLGWVCDQFRLGIDVEKAEIRIVNSEIDLGKFRESGGSARIEFEFSV